MLKGGEMEKKAGQIGKQQEHILQKRLFNKKTALYLFNTKIKRDIFSYQ